MHVGTQKNCEKFNKFFINQVNSSSKGNKFTPTSMLSVSKKAMYLTPEVYFKLEILKKKAPLQKITIILSQNDKSI